MEILEYFSSCHAKFKVKRLDFFIYRKIITNNCKYVWLVLKNC